MRDESEEIDRREGWREPEMAGEREREHSEERE